MYYIPPNIWHIQVILAHFHVVVAIHTIAFSLDPHLCAASAWI